MCATGTRTIENIVVGIEQARVRRIYAREIRLF